MIGVRTCFSAHVEEGLDGQIWSCEVGVSDNTCVLLGLTLSHVAGDGCRGELAALRQSTGY